MKKRILFGCLAAFLLLGCNSRSKKEAAAKDSYEKAKESLEQSEKNTPLAFLSVSSRDKHNLIGQMVIHGAISNNAKIAVYKDIELELSFYSKTRVLLEKDHETIYELIAPGKSVDFKSKYYAPTGTDSIGIRIVDAKPN